MTKKQKILLVFILIAVAVIAPLLTRRNKTADVPTPTPSGSVRLTPSTTIGGAVRSFVITGDSFSFDPKEIRVKRGDKVQIVFRNVEGFHDWVIDEFGARTQKIQAGQTDTIEFFADRVGTFEYYCSVGSHRQMGMRGNLIVQD